MWCTSRASPDSTTSPTRVRVRSRTRWWWTAETRSSDGIGASSVVELRSESTMTLAPSSMAAETLAPDPLDRLGQRPAAGLGRPPDVAGVADREQAVDRRRP